MKEPIVYLPEEIFFAGGTAPYYQKEEILEALDAADVKWVKETPEELKIRMMSLQIEELKNVCTKLQAQLKEAQEENRSLAGLLGDTQKHVDELYDKDEELKRAYLELQDQNEALKMTISDKSKQIERLERGPNANW